MTAFFNWIGSFLSTMANYFTGLLKVVGNIFNIVYKVISIVPSPILEITLSACIVIIAISTYKFLRKG